jgi:hypothetical protein
LRGRSPGNPDAERFRGLLTARARFVSVYFEDSHDTEDAATKLDLTR